MQKIQLNTPYFTYTNIINKFHKINDYILMFL